MNMLPRVALVCLLSLSISFIALAAENQAVSAQSATGFFEQTLVFRQTGRTFFHLPSIIVAKDGSVLAFCEERRNSASDGTKECAIVACRSTDHGVTWGGIQYLRSKDGMKWHMGSPILDETTGRILLMCGGGWLKSDDHGVTWSDWKPEIVAAEDGIGASTHGSSPGITLKHGPHAGRLLWPARGVDSRNGYKDSNLEDRRIKCYSTTLYSDDHGATVHRANLFLKGTGEATLIERLNGDIYFNARAYFEDGKRRTAISHDGGATFGEEGLASSIRELPQGCCAGIVRYPAELAHGADLVLFSNPDTLERKRVHGVVRLSLDGGNTWPYGKAINTDNDWFDYSSLAVGKDGKVLLMYKTTPTMKGIAKGPTGFSMAVARFDLAWLTDGAINLK